MTIAIIVAVDKLGGFSKNNEIPWHYPEDLQWFKQITTNHICVMGKNTYLDINNRTKNSNTILPNRSSYVLSTSLTDIKNAILIKELQDIKVNNEIIFIIGGGRLYEEYIDVVDLVYLTKINKEYNCDKFFPMDKLLQFELVEEHMSKHPDLCFQQLKRKY